MTEETNYQTPDGFRAVRFTDDDETVTYDGIVRIGAETWSGGLMPFITAATAQQIVDDWHATFPTRADTDGLWLDLAPMQDGSHDLVVYDDPDDPENSWGTLNLMDDPAYLRTAPDPRVWIDLGSVGLVWHEAAEPADRAFVAAEEAAGRDPLTGQALGAYYVADLQACAPEELTAVDGCVAVIQDERDSMGLPRVTVWGPTREAVLEYVRREWEGDADPEWFAECVVARIVEAAEPDDDWADSDWLFQIHIDGVADDARYPATDDISIALEHVAMALVREHTVISIVVAEAGATAEQTHDEIRDGVLARAAKLRAGGEGSPA